MSGKKPDCIECGWVAVHRNNILTLEFVSKYIGTFFEPGMSSMTLNVQNIISILEMENMKDEIELFQKVLIYLSSFLRAEDKYNANKQRIGVQGSNKHQRRKG